MLRRLLELLDVEPEEDGPVTLLLVISFMMGLFLATFTVASQSQFLNFFVESVTFPYALAGSGIIGVLLTSLYNKLEGRISFVNLSLTNLVIIILLAAFVKYGALFTIIEVKWTYAFGFALVLPFTFITTLIFWGAFARMFNLRQSKRIIGSVDLGMTLAQIIAFFSIPVLLSFSVPIDYLFTIALFSILAFTVLFFILGKRYLTNVPTGEGVYVEAHKKIRFAEFFKNRYILWMAFFIVISTIALRFVDYSFYNVTTAQFEPIYLPYFLSFFEAFIVVFGFLFTTFATDRINQDYGLRVSLIITPLVVIIFTVLAFAAGSTFGYDKAVVGGSAIFFFIMVAMSKLMINSLRDAIDNPTFKFYYVPIDKSIKIDAQTKIEGITTAMATALAGGLLILIREIQSFTLLMITLFTLPLLVLWYYFTNKMHSGYRDTLQLSLIKNKSLVAKENVQEFTIDGVLKQQVSSDVEDKIIYGLRLMEKLEPALFESSVMALGDSSLKRVKQFAVAKIQELGLQADNRELKGLATQAAGAAEDSDMLSISPEKLTRLSKSVRQADRMLAAKLLRKLIGPQTIFVLLELLRDPDPKVRIEAITTARRVKRQETWGVLVELLASPVYSYPAAAALKEAGSPALLVLEGAFHKSGQNDQVMLKIVQIIGHIGSQYALQLLWKKIDYPDKRVVRQILYSLRFIKYQAKGREITEVKELLDVEMSKRLWNMGALTELPAGNPEFRFLREALTEEIDENFNQIAVLLSLLYDPQSVQLAMENIQSGTIDGIAYGLELLDLFVDKDVKLKLIPLLDDSTTSDKLDKLQLYFPRESYNPIQAINYILNRDFNYNNRWSKVCAVHASAFMSDFRVSRGLISQMFNHDKFLQETAAWVIYNKDKTLYNDVSERLPYRDKRFLDSSIENNQLLDGLDDGFFLGIEMIMFIKQLPQFAGISGNLISDLADKIHPLDLRARERITFAGYEESPILIVAIGEVQIVTSTGEELSLKKGEVFGDLFRDGASFKATEAKAIERSVVFRINLPDFYYVLASHHELAQGIIKNITHKAVTQ